MKELDYIQLDTETCQQITADQAWFYSIVPKEFDQKKIVFFTSEKNKLNNQQDELEMILGKEVTFEICPEEKLKRTLGRYYRKNTQADTSKQTGSFSFKTEDNLEELFIEAARLSSSDIHIEVYESNCRIRFRIDGKLIERYVMNKSDYPVLVNKLKIKASLNISEKRLPQDGRISFRFDDNKYDVRVSVLPTLSGEKIVLRLLNRNIAGIDINKLGFSQDQLNVYMESVKKPHGIILISGPTGSGKTTTLYATLKILNSVDKNIITIEDPIEYTLEGINQVQLHEQIGLTFSSALRTFLRQDPDIIMLGEIRDAETAQLAIRAALTGHLILSTIHTNSAAGSVSRLIDMGIPPYLLSGTLNISVAQRLVRLLCEHCKKKIPFDRNVLPPGFSLPVDIHSYYTNSGCEHCFYTGYKGRTAIYELLPLTNENISPSGDTDLNAIVRKKSKNMIKLSQQALELVIHGKTSIDEVYSMLIG